MESDKYDLWNAQRQTYIAMLKIKIFRGVLSEKGAEASLEEWMKHKHTFSTVKDNRAYTDISHLAELQKYLID